MWGTENSQGEISIDRSMPITLDGKYKFIYHAGELGPFALGYLPVLRHNSNTDDYDFSIQVPEKLIELEPGQTITITKNKRLKTYTIYDDEADSDMDIEETEDQPLTQLNQKKTLLKLRDGNSNSSNANDTSFRNIGDFTIDVNIPIYENYTQSNPLTITQNGSGVISIPQNYEGLGEINYEINVPQTTVNNYTQPTITTNGTYTIPNGYTGFNDFTVNVTNQINTLNINRVKVFYKQMSNIDDQENIWDFDTSYNATEITSSWSSSTPPIITNGRKTIYIGNFSNTNNSYISINVLSNPDGGSDTVPIPTNSSINYYKQINETLWKIIIWVVYLDDNNNYITLAISNNSNSTPSYTSDINISKHFLYNSYFTNQS